MVSRLNIAMSFTKLMALICALALDWRYDVRGWIASKVGGGVAQGYG